MDGSFLLLLMIAMLAAFMFMNMRRQRRQYQELQRLQSSLAVGDRVMTTSGMYGTVLSTTDNTIDLEVAPGVCTTWVRQAVREKVSTDTVDEAEETDLVDDVVEDGPKADGR